MSKKAVAFVILSSLILGAFGSWIWQRYIIPELNTVPFLVHYNLAPKAGPVVINTTQQIRVNEGSDTVAAVNAVEPWTVAVLVNGQLISGGLILTSDGLIATTGLAPNQPGAQGNLSIKLFDGTVLNGATVSGADPASPLVLVKVSAANLPTANFGAPDSLQLSQRMVALIPGIGEQQATVFDSYLSAQTNMINYAAIYSSEKNNRTFAIDGVQNLPSGAAIFSADGAVQGLASAAGIISADTIKTALNSYFSNNGKIVRNLIGINYQYVSKAQATLQSTKQGIELKAANREPAVLPGSPAQKAGLLAGDLVYALNDNQISAANSFESQIAAHKSGDVVKFSIQRGKSLLNVNLTIATQ